MICMCIYIYIYTHTNFDPLTWARGNCSQIGPPLRNNLAFVMALDPHSLGPSGWMCRNLVANCNFDEGSNDIGK